MIRWTFCLLGALVVMTCAAQAAEMVNSCREGAAAEDAQVRVDLLSDCLQSGVSEKNRATVLVNLGSAYVQLEQYVLARDALDEAISLAPDAAAAYFVRGFALEKLDDESGALADYDKAIELKGDFARALVNRGAIYGRRGEQQTAIENYDQAIAADPNYALGYLNRGAALMTVGEFDKAEADLTKAIDLGSGSAEAYATRAFANQQLGRDDAARADVVRAQELDPEVRVPNL